MSQISKKLNKINLNDISDENKVNNSRFADNKFLLEKNLFFWQIIKKFLLSINRRKNSKNDWFIFNSSTIF